MKVIIGFGCIPLAAGRIRWRRTRPIHCTQNQEPCSQIPEKNHGKKSPLPDTENVAMRILAPKILRHAQKRFCGTEIARRRCWWGRRHQILAIAKVSRNLMKGEEQAIVTKQGMAVYGFSIVFNYQSFNLLRYSNKCFPPLYMVKTGIGKNHTPLQKNGMPAIPKIQW